MADPEVYTGDPLMTIGPEIRADRHNPIRIASMFYISQHATSVAYRLRSGREVCTTRSELETQYGTWSTEPELVEDGRSTRLLRLSDGGAVFLGRTGDLLFVHPTEQAEIIRVRMVSGPPDVLWRSAATYEPAAHPIRGEIPRYWTLRETVSPHLSTYAVYDLRHLRVVGRSSDREETERLVARANGESCTKPSA